MEDSTIPGPEAIQIFLGQLLVDSGLNPVPELRDQMISDLEDRLATFLLQSVGSKLSPDDLVDFSKQLEEDPTRMQEFLVSKIPNLPQVYLDAMEEFRQSFLSA